MQGSSSPMSAADRHAALDGIRAFAILAVFASHVSTYTAGGWVGVEVFFVLSGFLITSRLLHERRTTGTIRLGRFYLRRALRLYPALLVLLVLGALFAPVLGDGGTLLGYLRTAAFAGLYLQDFVWGFSGNSHGGFGHTWSLAVEEQFYLLWPPVFILLVMWSPRRLPVVAAVVAAAGVFCVILLQEPSLGVPLSYFLPWTQAPLLLAGCALAAWGRLAPARAATVWAVAGAVGLLGCFAAASGPLPISHHMGLVLAGCAVFSVALIAGVEAAPDRGVARVLSWAPLAYLGRISYGFYLFYLPVIQLVNAAFPTTPSWFRITLDLSVTLTCAVASYHLLELPCLRLKSRFEPVARAEALPSAGPADRDEELTAASDRLRVPLVPAPRRGAQTQGYDLAAARQSVERVRAGA